MTTNDSGPKLPIFRPPEIGWKNNSLSRDPIDFNKLIKTNKKSQRIFLNEMTECYQRSDTNESVSKYKESNEYLENYFLRIHGYIGNPTLYKKNETVKFVWKSNFLSVDLSNGTGYFSFYDWNLEEGMAIMKMALNHTRMGNIQAQKGDYMNAKSSFFNAAQTCDYLSTFGVVGESVDDEKKPMELVRPFINSLSQVLKSIAMCCCVMYPSVILKDSKNPIIFKRDIFNNCSNDINQFIEVLDKYQKKGLRIEENLECDLHLFGVECRLNSLFYEAEKKTEDLKYGDSLGLMNLIEQEIIEIEEEYEDFPENQAFEETIEEFKIVLDEKKEFYKKYCEANSFIATNFEEGYEIEVVRKKKTTQLTSESSPWKASRPFVFE